MLGSGREATPPGAPGFPFGVQFKERALLKFIFGGPAPSKVRAGLARIEESHA
jgi:hypothetical protein